MLRSDVVCLQSISNPIYLRQPADPPNLNLVRQMADLTIISSHAVPENISLIHTESNFLTRKRFTFICPRLVEASFSILKFIYNHIYFLKSHLGVISCLLGFKMNSWWQYSAIMPFSSGMHSIVIELSF